MIPRQLIRPVIKGYISVPGVIGHRFYGSNPVEYRSREQLVGGATGGRRDGPQKNRSKTDLRRFKAVSLGEGKKGIRWAGLSYPIQTKPKADRWLNPKDLGIKKESGAPEYGEIDNKIHFVALEGVKRDTRPLSDKYWGQRGWTSKTLNGTYVGCPELPDGTPMTEFSSFVIEMKRVTNMTPAGRKKTLSVLVVVGNKNGAVGFAVGKGEDVKSAIRKAKNKAINYLQYIPRYQDHTVYHNIKVKCSRVNLIIERKVRGTGLSCHRIVTTICQLAGIKDVRAKLFSSSSTNPLNIVRATMKGLTSQETHQNLADKSGKFVVEFSRENYYRPMVVAVPKSQDTEDVKFRLKSMQLI